jgi:hypothetical protein
MLQVNFEDVFEESQMTVLITTQLRLPSQQHRIQYEQEMIHM